jgi:hypothetical protein
MEARRIKRPRCRVALAASLALLSLPLTARASDGTTPSTGARPAAGPITVGPSKARTDWGRPSPLELSLRGRVNELTTKQAALSKRWFVKKERDALDAELAGAKQALGDLVWGRAPEALKEQITQAKTDYTNARAQYVRLHNLSEDHRIAAQELLTFDNVLDEQAAHKMNVYRAKADVKYAESSRLKNRWVALSKLLEEEGAR